MTHATSWSRSKRKAQAQAKRVSLGGYARAHPRQCDHRSVSKALHGLLDLTPTQIRVGEILLRKVIPDLTHTDLSTTSTRRYVVEVPPQLSDEEWEKKYSLPPPALKSVQ